jgi:VIT1/CCC1 family predicted Fe2+/Mn2+ transporter
MENDSLSCDKQRDDAAMTIPSAHENEPHFITRSGWLRAAVLGANDGIVSISSLLVGVAAADTSASAVALAGVAGVTAGAMSMAAGEYVSVSSQSDIEKADIEREKQALKDEPDIEHAELVAIYEHRGLSRETAKQVAKELSAHDALGAHVRDELGLSEIHAANPLQAAFASGATFTVAGAIPLVAALVAPHAYIITTVLIVTVLALAILGVLGAKIGGAPLGPSVLRIVGWGVFAMAITAGIGKLFGVSV